MSGEEKVWNTVAICVTLFSVAACIAGKGCNASDNEALKSAIEHGCTVIGNERRVVICKGELK